MRPTNPYQGPDTRCAPFGASVAPPGAVVFHRYLQQVNNAKHAARADARCPIGQSAADPCRRDIRDTAELASVARPAASELASGAAKIGDLLPVAPTPPTRAVTEVVFQQRTPITGRLIDILS